MIPLGPRDPGPSRPDPARLPRGSVTRFAPAPTGHLHLGHLANALYVWGIARAARSAVVLRLEDHDRQRCRPAFETALLDDLERLGVRPDRPSITELRAGASAYRQSDDDAPYAAAVDLLRAQGRVYACACSRVELLRWRGPGCPLGCRALGVTEDAPDSALRAWLGAGEEAFDDLLLGPQVGDPSADGDLTLRDRRDNWSYPLCVVVDDARHGVDFVIRGRDLLDATARQLRLGRLLGRDRPPAFLHHPLVLKPGGAKLSKADNDTAVRDLLAAGHTPAELLGWAAAAVGLVPEPRPVAPDEVASLFA